MTRDMIPDFNIPAEKPPVTVLRELAAQLGHKTHNLVKGEVYTQALEGEQILHGFEARAVALDDYTLPLFYVTHGIAPYAAKIYLNKAPAQANATPVFECGGQDELEEKLAEVFNQPHIRGTVESMLSQSREIEMAF